MHVGLVNIIVLDLVEDFAINSKRFVGLVIRRVAEHVAQSRVTENDDRKRKYADTCRSIHAPPISIANGREDRTQNCPVSITLPHSRTRREIEWKPGRRERSTKGKSSWQQEDTANSEIVVQLPHLNIPSPLAFL